MTQQNEALFYRAKDICELMQVSRSTVYRLTRDGILPQPLKLTARMVVWKKSDIEQWAEQIRHAASLNNKHLIDSKKSLS